MYMTVKQAAEKWGDHAQGTKLDDPVGCEKTGGWTV